MDVVGLTQELVRFRTINPPGDEEACARHLAGLLEAAGFGISLHEFAPRRTSVVARLGDTAAPLCFTGHIDTVPLGTRPWSHDAFAGEIASGRLYGRGTSDMKSGVAAFVVAATQLAPRLASTAGVVLVITAGEETGCTGAAHLATQRDALGRAGAMVVAEPTGNIPMVGHKGALWLSARATGVTAHGSMPERGVNAVYKAARAVTKLERFEFDVAAHPVLGPPTLNVGSFHGGLNINSVPDSAEAQIDIRSIPAQQHSAILDLLGDVVGEDVTLARIVDVEGVWTDPAQPWMREVATVAGEITSRPPGVSAAPYFTDASVLTPAYGGAPTVILGPGELAMAHQTDEYCVVDRLGEAVEIYTRLIARWCRI